MCDCILGVYFTSHIEHVKFVDFCGKYRVPLLRYLCSPKCSNDPIAYEENDPETEEELEGPVFVKQKIKKVLLG